MAIKINGSTIIDDSRKGVNFDSVGIGTTNPTENLDIFGNVKINQGDLLVGTGRTFVVSTSTGTTSYISARSGILTTALQEPIIPPVDNVNNFPNDRLLGGDIDFSGNISIGQTEFTIGFFEQAFFEVILSDSSYDGPSIDSGRYFLIPTNGNAEELFGERTNRVISYNTGTNTFTVEIPSEISTNLDPTDNPAEFQLVYGDIIQEVESNLIGIGTDNPLYPLHIVPPVELRDAAYPSLFVDGSAYIKGDFLELGDFSITLDARVNGAEKISFSRGNNIGIHSESNNSIAASGSLAAESVIESVGLGTHNIVSYNVTVGVKTTGDVHLGAGSTEKFLIEGNRTPHLHLTAGRTYRFNQDDASNANHTLKFYNDLEQTTEISGVTTVGTAGTEGAYTELSVHSFNTPSRIFYGSISTSHVGNMAMVEATSNHTNSGLVTFSSISVADDLNISGITTLQGNIFVPSDTYLRLGDSNTLTLSQTSNTNTIQSSSIHGIQFYTQKIVLKNQAANETLAEFTQNGSVDLYYDNSKKFETTGYGVTVTGIVSATSYYGDGSNLTGVEAASFLFNTGITSSVSAVATGVGSTILTLPSLDGQKYIIHSILASNIAVGNTEVNFVGAFDFDGGERSYFANQIPIPTGTSVEMLKQPQVLNRNDKIIVRSTDFNRVGADNIINVYVSYEEKTSADLIGIGIGTVGLAATSTTTIYTSSTYPSVVQSIRLVNKVDTGPKIASVSISNGVSTTFLVDNLIVPKYGSIEILDNPKSIQTDDVVQVQLEEGASINVQLSAKKITN